jgi:uncharacterized membrane protein
MTKRAAIATGVAAVVAVAAGVTTRELTSTGFVVPPSATPESYGIKFTLKGCAQRAAGTTRVGGKGVLYMSGDADWWFVKSETVTAAVPGEDFTPPVFQGYMTPGTWQGSAFAETSGGTFRFYWASRKCPGATAGTYKGDASITTVTVLPKL